MCWAWPLTTCMNGSPGGLLSGEAWMQQLSKDLPKAEPQTGWLWVKAEKEGKLARQVGQLSVLALRGEGAPWHSAGVQCSKLKPS